jgi:hypothetical protein
MRCSKTPPPFVLQLHRVGSSLEFRSSSVWLEIVGVARVQLQSHPKQALYNQFPIMWYHKQPPGSILFGFYVCVFMRENEQYIKNLDKVLLVIVMYIVLSLKM